MTPFERNKISKFFTIVEAMLYCYNKFKAACLNSSMVKMILTIPFATAKMSILNVENIPSMDTIYLGKPRSV
jgi:hypothetical protein